VASFWTRFWSRAGDYYRLKPAYKIVSTVVVLLGGSVGLFFWYLLARYLRFLLGIPLEGGSLEGIRGPFLTWALGVLIALPLTIIPSTVFVALIVGIIFCFARAISLREAIHFGLLGRYPASWF
jgi:hypothetical protein